MGSAKINERILEGIRGSCEGDEVMRTFLIQLVYEEADHPGQWWWKETYKKLVDEHSASWEERNED